MSESYVVRDSPRRAVGTVIAIYGSAIAPALIAFLIFLASPDFRVMPLIGVGLLITAMAMTVLAVMLVVAGTKRLRSGLRREIIVAVDLGGIHLGRGAFAGDIRSIPWSQVRRLVYYTLCERRGSGEDPPLVHTDYLQVSIVGERPERLVAPEGRNPWGDLDAAIAHFAPHIEINHVGTYPEGEDPLRQR